MFNFTFKISLISILFTLSAISPAFAKDNPIEGPFFKSGESIVIDSKILGDTFIAGKNILIENEIDGDLFIIGQTVKINAPIHGDVRIIASRVEILEHITGSLAFVITDRLYIPSIGEIDEDAYGVVNELIHEGRIGRNLKTVGVSEDSMARIDGKVLGNYEYGFKDAGVTEKGFVQGDVTKIPFQMNMSKNDKMIKSTEVISKLLHSLAMVLLGTILILINKNFINKSLHEYTKDFRANLLKGTLVILILPVILVALLTSLIGIPLSFIIIFSIISLLYVSALYPSMYIGQRLMPNAKKEITFTQLLIGVLIFDVIALAPIVGIIASLFTSIAFLGLIARKIVNRQ